LIVVERDRAVERVGDAFIVATRRSGWYCPREISEGRFVAKKGGEGLFARRAVAPSGIALSGIVAADLSFVRLKTSIIKERRFEGKTSKSPFDEST